MGRPAKALAAVTLAIGTLCQCAVGPTYSERIYELKAGASVEQLQSDVETTSQVIELYVNGNGFGPWADVTITNAEQSVSGVDSAFMSRQPPTATSDRLREQTSTLLDQAQQLVEEARLGVRRGDVQTLTELQQQLDELSPKLEKFVEAHS